MGVDKIAGFYDDPVKQACDRFSIDKAYGLKAFSTDPGLTWALRRRIKFLVHLMRGKLRRLAPRRNSPSVYRTFQHVR
jgi:hypothetical protein